MGEAGIIGLDLARNVFQAHGAGADGSVVFRRKLSRGQLLEFLGRQPRRVVAMEACASAHHWGRAIGDLGHEVRLIPPAYVKPRVEAAEERHGGCRGHRRGFKLFAQQSDDPGDRWKAQMVATDHAAQGGEERGASRAAAMAYRTRDLLVRQRRQTTRALRAHLAEHGIVAPTGPGRMSVASRPSSRGMMAGCLRRCATWLACFWVRSPT